MFSFREAYTVCTIILITIDLLLAINSYSKSSREGRYLCRAAVLAAIVAFSYLISILEDNYFGASFMSSFYFISIDWLLITMIKFTTVITTRVHQRKDRRLMYVLEIYALFDSAVLMINPFKEIAVHYVWRPTIIACYEYKMKPLYYAHLIFTYLMVIAVLGILFYKIFRTPRQYRNQYSFIVAAVLFVVIVNGLFLLPEPKHVYNLLDTSIVGYSVGLMVMYWSSFIYRSIYLQQGLSNMVLDNLDQGVLLFDYDGFLVMKNDKADDMLPFVRPYDELNGDLYVRKFLELCGISAERHDIGEHYSIQLFADSGVRVYAQEETETAAYEDAQEEVEKGIQLRCDYRRLDNADRDRIGELFVFTAVSEEIDVMTGFHSWEYFREYVMENPDSFRHPCAVAEFDINELGNINRIQGKEIGDMMIRSLSETVRQCMPEETYYVRGHDAHLIAIAYFADESEMKTYGESVTELFEGQLEIGYSSSDTEETDILALIQEASRAMMIKKLMDGDSARSQTLSSLIRALKECDSDTEAHVKRTQNMGRELGRRFGLTDLQQSQLAMLCLLHDIGKVGVPLEILNKPGKLTDEEWAVLKTHAEKGYQIAISSWELRDIADMILYHHERWDGRGYPKGLSGEEIPFLSRIISVVDSYDAMVSNRSYRKGMPPEKAQAELRRCAGTQFDPDIAAEFLKMLEETPELFEDREGRAAAKVTEVAAKHSDRADTDTVLPGIALADEKAGADDNAANWRQDQGSAGTATQAEVSSAKHGIIYHPEKPAIPDEGQMIPAEVFYARNQINHHIQSHPVAFSRYMMNLDDYIIDADENFENFTGYGAEDIASGRLRQRNLIPEEDREVYFAEVDKQMEKENAVYMEHYLLRKDGERIYVFCYARKFYHSASRSLRIEVVIVDMARTRLMKDVLPSESDSEVRAFQAEAADTGREEG